MSDFTPIAIDDIIPINFNDSQLTPQGNSLVPVPGCKLVFSVRETKFLKMCFYFTCDEQVAKLPQQSCFFLLPDEEGAQQKSVSIQLTQEHILSHSFLSGMNSGCGQSPGRHCKTKYYLFKPKKF